MMKKFAVILLLMPAALSTLNAQSPVFNAVYWGTYLQDNLHYPLSILPIPTSLTGLL